MSDKDIFSQDDKSDKGTANQSTDPFAEMVGEDKRYKSPQELAKGKQEADQFIEQLKEEAAQLRDELNKRLTAEEILEQVKASAGKDAQGNQSQLSAEQIAELVQGTVQTLDSEKSAQENLDKSTQLMQEKYGDKAAEMIVQKARELGLTPADLQSTAKQSPAAFAQLMGLDQKSNLHTQSTDGTINTQALESQNGSHSGPAEFSYKWFEQIRKTNPREYYSPAVQNQMFQKRKELGDKFYQ